MHLRLTSFILYLFSFLLIVFTISYIISLGSDVFGFDTGSIPNGTTTLLEFLGILYIFIKLKTIQKIPYLLAGVIVWFFWMCFNSLLTTDLPLYIHLRETLFWPILFIFSFCLCTSKEMNISRLKYCFILIMLVSTVLFFKISTARTAMIISNLEGYIASVNYIYFPLLTLPWIFLVKKEAIRNFLLFVIFLAAIISAKRSAILICILIAIVYIWFNYIKNKKSHAIIRIAIPIIFIVCIYFFISNVMSSRSEYVFSRFSSISEDKGSGRDIVWRNVLDTYSKSPVLEKIIGHGHNSAIIVNRGHNIDLSAHNDFLEVLFDYGIIGLILYLLLHIYLIKRLFFLKRNKSELFLPYLASYITMFIMSMVSHLILYPTYFTFLATFWGAVEGQLYKKRFGVSG